MRLGILKISRKLLVFFISFFPAFLFLATNSYCGKNVITMGYRTNERAPFIGKSPDNSGLYFSLYEMAAKKIGCELKVVRKSKKRVLNGLKEGEIDFYPGFNFTESRGKYVYYFENGLPGGDIGLSLDTRPEITNLHQLIENDYTLFVARGGAKHLDGVRLNKVSELNLDKVTTLLKLKRGDFYIYNKSTLEYYLKKNNLKGFKLHPNCCGGIIPLFLAFSQSSPHFMAKRNLDYNSGKPVSISNFPIKVDPDCVAAKFAKALMDLKTSGKTGETYKYYYHAPMTD